MDLKEILNNESLKQDKWTETRPVFGDRGQLEVVGWIEKIGNNKFYCLKCSICSQDPELFGEGYFKSPKHSLKRALPCGCAKAPRWTKLQRIVQCERASASNGNKFIGFVGEYSGKLTKTIQECPVHGLWENATIDSLVNSKKGCQKCHFDSITENNYKPDEVMILSFMASGNFHPDTKFWRSDRKTKSGNVAYWNVYCPECETYSEGLNGNLQQGCRPCACGRMRQKYAYIHMLKDSDNRPVAIKFGITRRPEQRVKEQNSKTCFDLQTIGIWEFSSTSDCKEAERICKNSFKCGIIEQDLMRDGFSETTFVYNIDEVINIYEQNGGIRLQ